MRIKSYELRFDIDFDQLKFSCKERISLKTEKTLRLNSVGLSIKSVKKSGKEISFKVKDDLLSIPGRFEGDIDIEFEGKVNDTLTGLYRANYGNSYMLSSFLSSTNARKLFPCVDAPSYKAAFDISVTLNKDLQCVSNMPVKSVKTISSRKTIKFFRTPKMSTYLLYIGLGKLDTLSQKSGKTAISVVATEGKSRYGEFAIDIGKRSIQFFSRFFDFRYPLPKLDLISVPEFSVGGMENWGAITFREKSLIVSPESSAVTKMQAADTIAHEIAHQWFGDLVTTKDWNDIWLNESFATFMSYKFLDENFHAWKPFYDFFESRMTSAFMLDSLDSSHPVIIKIKSPEEANEVYDNISSYGKSVAILRMIESFIGQDKFRFAIRFFIKKHKFDNAVSDDLWSSFEKTSEQPIKSIMHDFVDQQGYPLITVKKSANGITINQDEFNLNKNKKNTLWKIPITASINGSVYRFVLKNRETEIKTGKITYLKINLDRVGFYRIKYDGLEDGFWKSKPSAFERWGFISDKFAFLLAGRIKPAEYTKHIERLYKETESLVVNEILTELMTLWVLKPESDRKIAVWFIKEQINRLKGKETDLDKILRGRLYYYLSLLDADFARELSEKFNEFYTLDSNIKNAVALAYALTTNDIGTLKERLESAIMDEERQYIINAFRGLDGVNIDEALAYILSGKLRKQESAALIMVLAANPKASGKLWGWIKNNHGALEETYKGSLMFSSILQRTIPLIGISRAKEVGAFLRKKGYLKKSRAARIGLELLNIYDRLSRALEHESL